MKTIEQPFVSFIIPVLNGERDIARCLLSIRNQKFLEGTCEVLIMDNGSTDQSLEILQKQSGIVVLVRDRSPVGVHDPGLWWRPRRWCTTAWKSLTYPPSTI